MTAACPHPACGKQAWQSGSDTKTLPKGRNRGFFPAAAPTDLQNADKTIKKQKPEKATDYQQNYVINKQTHRKNHHQLTIIKHQ